MLHACPDHLAANHALWLNDLQACTLVPLLAPWPSPMLLSRCSRSSRERSANDNRDRSARFTSLIRIPYNAFIIKALDMVSIPPVADPPAGDSPTPGTRARLGEATPLR